MVAPFGEFVRIGAKRSEQNKSDNVADSFAKEKFIDQKEISKGAAVDSSMIFFILVVIWIVCTN